MNPKLIELNNLILQQQPEKSDVIVWLQGDRFDRGPKVIELFQKGWAPKILITGNNELAGLGKRPGENDVSLAEIKEWLIKRGIKERDIIFDDKAFNTREQALNTLHLAKREGWNKIIIVGSWPYYQFRAFLTFLKTADELQWTGKIINQPVVLAEETIPGGREKTVKELLAEEIVKLEKYKEHLADIEEGSRHLLLNKEILSFRKAKMADADLLLQWRNDPIVRQFSFNQQIISKGEHIGWLEKVLKDSRRHLYIIINLQGESIGVVRFDEVGETAEINITIADEFRGKGYGCQSIWQACRFFLASHPHIKKVIARIKEENEVSIKSFAKANFKENKRENRMVYLEFKAGI